MRSTLKCNQLLFPCFFLLLIVFIGFAFYWRIFLMQPLLGPNQKLILDIQPGTSALGVIQQGRRAGLFDQKSAFLFHVLLYVRGEQDRLQAGEYQFVSGITPSLVLQKLVQGDVLQHTVQITEGWTAQDLLRSLHNDPAILPTLKGLEGSQIMISLGYSGTSLEGWFFPDTYFFTKGTKDVDILRRAHQALLSHLQLAWMARDPAITLKSPYEALILSSIIEKEAALDEERSQISGVFHRRLRQGIPLQADPTVIYGLGESFQGSLTRQDLKKDTPYNTYLHKGLPPTPIALSGLKSIQAALHPDDAKTLYFVAKGDGRHYFSRDLKEHNQAVIKYQLGKQNGKASKEE